MSDYPCVIKEFGGCACKDTCAERPVTPAPVVIPTWQNHLAALAFGIVMSLLAYSFMDAWNEQIRKETTINQENVYADR